MPLGPRAPIVSILVLVDSSLQARGPRLIITALLCFNPCFSGFLSSSSCKKAYRVSAPHGFNPCFSGFLSSSPANWMVLALGKSRFQSLF